MITEPDIFGGGRDGLFVCALLLDHSLRTNGFGLWVLDCAGDGCPLPVQWMRILVLRHSLCFGISVSTLHYIYMLTDLLFAFSMVCLSFNTATMRYRNGNARTQNTNWMYFRPKPTNMTHTGTALVQGGTTTQRTQRLPSCFDSRRQIS